MHFIRRCANSICGRPFQVNEFSNSFSNTVSPEDELGKIICPHCGVESKGNMHFFYLTHALSQDQEIEFNANSPSGTTNGTL